MITLQTLFWISLAVLFYCYIGYGLIVYCWNSLRGKKRILKETPTEVPVTMIIAAYNEEQVLEEKIRNTIAIDYPAGKLEIIIITDGSTDRSGMIVQGSERIKWLHQPERRGKYAAIKRAIKEVSTPVVIFSDANTLLNPECIWKIIRHYSDPKTGGVAGEKKIGRDLLSPVGEAEGLYWQYESRLKKLDADLNTVTGAAGELFSIRTELFTELDDNLLLDDFVISMQVCLKGFRIGYEPGAFATEAPSISLKEEAKRKIRISAGAYQSIGFLKGCLNFFRHPVLSFQYFSRRLLRWILCPIMLLLALITNTLIVIEWHYLLFQVLWWVQVGFYLLAVIGWLRVTAGYSAGWMTIPFYFVFMNYCLVRGFFRYISGKQKILWDKSVRQIK